MNILVAGWFSFEEMGASAGDLLAQQEVCRWLDSANCSYDVAFAAPFDGGVNWEHVQPDQYSHVIFVCGPLGNGPPVDQFFVRFSRQKMIGINLTMLETLETWNPFDILWERDSSRCSRPDLVFRSPKAEVPVVGILRIDAQPEYGSRCRIEQANHLIAQLLESRTAATVPIDTRLDRNLNDFQESAQVESLISRMDSVITTRLHGMVLALKRGVPAVVIDSVAGGDKVTRQAAAIGWPLCFPAEDVTLEQLESALDFCLSSEGRNAANECRTRCCRILADIDREFVDFLGRGEPDE